MMTALGESTYEAVFDHGGEGYGIWFDGMVRDDPMYKQFWKGLGLRSIYVTLEEDRIVIVRDLDREIPIVASAASDKDSRDDDQSEGVDAFAAEVAKADEVTYTPEEAARLFATEAAAQGTPTEAPAPEAATETTEPTAAAEAAEATVEDASAEAGDEAEAEAAPKKPAARRRVTTRRAPAKKKEPAGDDE